MGKRTTTRRRKTVLSRTKTNHMLNLISFAKPGSLFIVSRSFAGNRLREVGLVTFAAPHAFLKGSLRTTFQPEEYQHDFKEQGWHRALASDQCGPGLNPGVDTICRLSLLLVLFLFSGYSGFPVSIKTKMSNYNSIWNARTCFKSS